ncbi:(2Fe-2S)-binding protein [Ktedonosporobacter rubrisoli]|uniref:(2Fe-2S)-binding protein n=1 Tax=Ktedonosporobacter rubrisoli TaxID=2509675 RepID=A0A4V0Z0J8_KTERU|nr:(2Fe-2S)-binding protein [Ktedonosporobacter rubrisoli]
MPGQPQEYHVGHISEFPANSHKVVKVAGRSIGIFHIKGQWYGLPNICPHQLGPLCEARELTGTIVATKETNWQRQWAYEGEVVRCPWHGLEFHVPTGQCLALPGIRLRCYKVIIDGEQVRVRL